MDTDTGVTAPAVQTPEGEDAGSDNAAQVGQSQVATTQAPAAKVDPLQWLETAEIDPTVKSELKAGYLRQSDYTKKTQEIASLRKAAEEYEQWKPALSKIAGDATLQKLVFGQAEAQANAEDQIPDDPKEYANWVKQQAVEQAKAEIMGEIQRDREMAAAEQLDPRLQQDQQFASLIAGIVAQDDDFRACKKTAVEATKNALEAYKAYEEKIRQQVLSEMTTKAKKQTMVIPSKEGSPAGATTKGSPKTMQEAAALAEEMLS